MKLSQNFTLEELTASQTASRKNIDNTPDDDTIDNLKRLCKLLEELRLLIGKPITITSGYRSPELNKAIGGALGSQHSKGCAADFRISGYTPDEIIRIILTAGIRFDQLIREFDSWVHISIPLNTKSWRNECLIIDKNGTRPYGKYKPLVPPNTQKPKPLTKSRTVANAGLAGAVGTAIVAAPVIEPAGEVVRIAQENPQGLLLVLGIVLIVFAAVAIYLRLDDRRKGRA